LELTFFIFQRLVFYVERSEKQFLKISFDFFGISKLFFYLDFLFHFQFLFCYFLSLFFPPLFNSFSTNLCGKLICSVVFV